MHPRTTALLDHLQAHREALAAALDATPVPLRERRPGAERWSIAEVLEHLAVVEAQIAALLKRGLRAALADGALPPLAGDVRAAGGLDGTALLDRERRLQARPNVSPSQGWTAQQAWDALARSRATLTEVVLAADGLDASSIRAPHPFLGELTFPQWLEFVGYHEGRHAAQIRATAAELAG